MIGYFDDNKREYVITNMKPRRHLYNYLWNEESVCKCDQFGNGFSWMAVGTDRRDVENGERNIYIKDKRTGKYWSANGNYNDLPFDLHECCVGLGYHTVISEYDGIRTEFTVLVPVRGAATLYKVKVKNLGKERSFGVYFCIQPKPALSWHDAYGEADYSKETGGLLYTHDGFRLPNDYTKISVASDKPFYAFDVGNEHFRGEYNGFHNPIGLSKEKLSCKGSTFSSDYVAVIQYDVELKDGEEFEFTVCAFAATSIAECAELNKKYLAEGEFERQLELQRQINGEYCDTFTINSPDKVLNSQVNIWLKRQLSLGKTWGRLYGKGYRDVMQDITAFVSFDCSLARERILHALKYQYEDGNPIRMFEPNFRYPYNDGGVWITGAVLSYINESGDLSILKEEVPFLKGNSYESVNLADAYVAEPYVCGERKGSVLDHLRAAIDYLINCRGKRNLVLWRGGDWNDSINSAGLNNKGESVWLSIATVKAITELQGILKIIGGDTKEIETYEHAKTQLKSAIEINGKCGAHYIYGINDDGEIIGGEDRIFLNPQTWAVLSDVADSEALENAMDEVERKLKCAYGYVQCYPSFIKGSENIGRASYFKPGLVENGAVYNHGVAFKIVADCMLGRGDNAYETLKLISFDNPDNADNGMEPYAVSNMFMGPENPYIAGYAPMSWITGTAGWIYRAVTEYMCGIKPTIKGLKIEPCLPSSWNELKITRKFRGEIYDISFVKTGEQKVVCDGLPCEILPLSGKGSYHLVKVEF